VDSVQGDRRRLTERESITTFRREPRKKRGYKGRYKWPRDNSTPLPTGQKHPPDRKSRVSRTRKDLGEAQKR